MKQNPTKTNKPKTKRPMEAIFCASTTSGHPVTLLWMNWIFLCYRNWYYKLVRGGICVYFLLLVMLSCLDWTSAAMAHVNTISWSYVCINICFLKPLVVIHFFWLLVFSPPLPHRYLRCEVRGLMNASYLRMSSQNSLTLCILSSC